MNRIDEVFVHLNKRKQKALVIFVTAGDPSMKVTREILRFADTSGVDCVELGVPFSDPLADGSVIQESSLRSIKKGVHLEGILNLVHQERKRGLKVPVILMSSFNPIYQMGLKKTIQTGSKSGVDGLIIPDLPVHEASEILCFCREFHVHPILMMTPTTTPQRRELIRKKSRGFIYYVSLKGVTGERQRSRYPFRSDVRKIRQGSQTPVCVGFGVASPVDAKNIAQFADGVIVGSSIVKHLDRYSRNGLSSKSKAWILEFVKAIKKVHS